MDDVLPKTVAELWDSIAKGDWVLAFGFLTMLLTRLFAIKPLQDKIPKEYLRYVALVLGMLSQASAALVGGASWPKALIMGALAGLSSIGFWEAGMKAAPVLKKAGTGAGIVILGLCAAMATSGCAAEFPGKVSQMSTGVASLRQVSREAYKYKCGKLVDECKKTKSPTSQPTLDDCKIWKDCDSQREKLFFAASSTQMLLDTTLVLWQMGNPEDAKAMFERAKAAFENLKEKITEYKLLKEVLQ